MLGLTLLLYGLATEIAALMGLEPLRFERYCSLFCRQGQSPLAMEFQEH